MKHSGQIVLFRFPQTDLLSGKLRPALLLGKLPGIYDDWLMCMISSQESQYIPDFDETIREDDPDFARSGLRVSSIIRCGRLAVVEGTTLAGAIGDIGSERLQRIKARIATWLMQA